MTPQDLDSMKRSDLLTLAKQIGVKGFSRLTKSELIQSVMETVEKGGDVLKKELQKFQKRLEQSSTLRAGETAKAESPRAATGPRTRAYRCGNRAAVPGILKRTEHRLHNAPKKPIGASKGRRNQRPAEPLDDDAAPAPGWNPCAT
jgi:hypothetical protein